MATAVGVNVLTHKVPAIVSGIRARWKDGNSAAMNIIICQNLIDSDKYLKKLNRNELNPSEQSALDDCIGFVKASIGQMMPIVTPDSVQKNVLRVSVEEYDKLPVDKAGFVSEIPSVRI